MGLTSALNTSLNGLALNEQTIDVLGNNIANAGTNGFKASQVLFTTQLSRTLTVGSRPSDSNGGTNPQQIGLGATTAAIVRDFSQGSISNSTSPSDLAIQGNGFFILDGAEGNVYTRNGNFTLNSTNKLINAQGAVVQGYGVNEQFQIVPTQLQPVEIPLGELNIAQQTRNVQMNGALLPTGAVGDRGTVIRSDAMTDAANANAPVTTTTLLSDAEIGGNSLYTVGETLSLSLRKGGRTTEALTLDVTATSTVQDLLTFIDNAIGIQSDSGIPNDAGTGGAPGVTISAAGEIVVVGNAGDVNDLDMAVGDLTSDGAVVPITFAKEQTAVGESTTTSFVIFDSLGEDILVRMTSVLESRDSTTTTFRYFLESADDSREDIAIGSGTVIFDSQGKVSENGTATFSFQRGNSAAVSPMQVQFDLTQISGISSESSGSTLNLAIQDGAAPGTLTNFVIDETGTINGVFDNGIIRTLGQVVLARFSNPQGLLEAGGGTFKEGVSSGSPALVSPGAFGAGTIRAGAIELSNTDIGRNLVDLIVASTNYRGNARVIDSVQQLIDELLLLGR